jgi:hypothetical protein
MTGFEQNKLSRMMRISTLFNHVMQSYIMSVDCHCQEMHRELPPKFKSYLRASCKQEQNQKRQFSTAISTTDILARVG